MRSSAVAVVLAASALCASAVWYVGDELIAREKCKNQNIVHLYVHPADANHIAQKVLVSIVCRPGKANIWGTQYSSVAVQQLVNKNRGTLRVLAPYYNGGSLLFAVVLNPDTKYGSVWRWGVTRRQLARLVPKDGSVINLVPYTNLARERVYSFVASLDPGMRSKSKYVMATTTAELRKMTKNTGWSIGALYPYTSSYATFDATLFKLDPKTRWYSYWGYSRDEVYGKVDKNLACLTTAVPYTDSLVPQGFKWSVTMQRCGPSTASTATEPGVAANEDRNNNSGRTGGGGTESRATAEEDVGSSEEPERDTEPAAEAGPARVTRPSATPTPSPTRKSTSAPPPPPPQPLGVNGNEPLSGGGSGTGGGTSTSSSRSETRTNGPGGQTTNANSNSISGENAFSSSFSFSEVTQG